MRVCFPLSKWNQQRQFEKAVWVYPAHIAMFATYLRNQGHDVVWDGVDDGTFDKVITNDFEIDVEFADLPFPDRVFTNAKDQRWQKYGNYRRKPATHMMVSNLCWYGKCTFCIDTYKLEQGEQRGIRSVAHVMEEIDDLIAHGYREVFDDSGTFPVGTWLEEFCTHMQTRKHQIMLGCNMKPVKLDYRMMADAGFKFILVGIESANQRTIDRIQKGQRAEDIVPIIKSMSDAGLAPHVTFMSSYPWETESEEQRTIDLCAFLLKKGYAKTAQASIYSPPRTQPAPDSIGHRRIPQYFQAYRSPEFWYHKVRDLRGWDDVMYLVRGGRLICEEHWRKFWTRYQKHTQAVS